MNQNQWPPDHFEEHQADLRAILPGTRDTGCLPDSFVTAQQAIPTASSLLLDWMACSSWQYDTAPRGVRRRASVTVWCGVSFTWCERRRTEGGRHHEYPVRASRRRA